MQTLIKNIKGLVQYADAVPAKIGGTQMQNLPVLENAFLLIRDGNVEDFGEMKHLPSATGFDEIIDAEGSFVLPTWIDSHTHMVFPASRENEFMLKIKGASYEEIAASGGGILNSAKKLAGISEDELFEISMKRLKSVIAMGTGAVEIKSGYGLSVEGELKMLRVIDRIKKESPALVKSTFLGAHAIPEKFKTDKKGYLDQIVNEMLPEIGKKNLADYADIFIEKGFFSPDDAEYILENAVKSGLKPRLHIDQMNDIGGMKIAVKYGAVSVDHLENSSNESLGILKESEIIPVLLPSCSFYLRMNYPNARKMIEMGMPVCLATDFNPGSSPSGNMNFVMSLACIQMKMLPNEVINAVTINAAHALEIEKTHGVIRKGAQANLIITEKIPSLPFMMYSFGRHSVSKVLLNGIEIINH